MCVVDGVSKGVVCDDAAAAGRCVEDCPGLSLIGEVIVLYMIRQRCIVRKKL